MATVDDTRDDDAEVEPSLPDLAFVGDATAGTLEDAGVTAREIREKAVSYRQLVAAGVNPGVAGKLRREHSLHWTLEERGADLDRRSERVRGLQDGEREWVAATGLGDADEDDSTGTSESYAGDGDWTPSTSGASDEPTSGEPSSDEPDADESTATGTTEADGAGDALAAEAAWRERATSPPVTSLPSIGRSEADALAAAGVDTVRRLATADPGHLATQLGLPAERVRAWCDAARERAD